MSQNDKPRYRKTNTDYEKGIEETMTEENDENLNTLYKAVKDIKLFSTQINKSIKNSIGTASIIEDDMSKSKGLVQDTIRKLGLVYSANSKVFCYLMLFVFGLLFFLYKITG